MKPTPVITLDHRVGAEPSRADEVIHTGKAGPIRLLGCLDANGNPVIYWQVTPAIMTRRIRLGYERFASAFVSKMAQRVTGKSDARSLIVSL